MKTCLTFLCLLTPVAAQPLNVLPVPAKVVQGDGILEIGSNFRAALGGYSEPRLRLALDRFREQLTKATGLPAPPAVDKGQPAPALTLIVQCAAAGKPVQAMDEDESYKLVITTKQARLTAPNPLGILRGLET